MGVVSLFKGRVDLADSALDDVGQVFQKEIALLIHEELRPLRELLMAMSVSLQQASQQGSIVQDSNRLYEDVPRMPVAKSITKLESEKMGSEVIMTLFDKMNRPHPSSLRPFYTDLEQEASLEISAIHKRRTKDIIKGQDGKYPYRKVDTVLSVVDPDFVFEYAKKYVFSRK